jgi:hypothetical protein
MHGIGDGVAMARDDSSLALQGVAVVLVLLTDSEGGAGVRVDMLGCRTETCSEDGVLLQKGVEQLLDVGDVSPAGFGNGRTRSGGLRDRGRPIGITCRVAWLPVQSTTPCWGGVVGCVGDLCNRAPNR